MSFPSLPLKTPLYRCGFRRAVKMVVPALLLFVSGCVTASVSHSIPGVSIRYSTAATAVPQPQHRPLFRSVPSAAVASATPVSREVIRPVHQPPIVLARHVSSGMSPHDYRCLPVSPAWTTQLVSYHSHDPAWLTGGIEPAAGSLQPSMNAQWISAKQSVLLDPQPPILTTPTYDTAVGGSFQQHPDDSAPQFRIDPPPSVVEPSIFSRIAADHRFFYSPDSLIGLSYGLAGGTLMANTNFDNTVQAHFQSSVRNASSDEWFDYLGAHKELGNGYRTIPVFAAAWAVGSLFDEYPAGDNLSEWGERSFRSILVGAPPMLATQYIIGGSRPNEPAGSHWAPFQDHNGVSGHAFMGAVPFLTAAQMAEEPWLKFAFYAGSTLVPLSRINDDDHYTSQAFLGWWFALLATKAIDSTQQGHTDWTFAPWLEPGTSGFAAEYRF